MLWCAALLLALTTECEAGWSSRGWTSRSSGSWWGGSRSSSSSHWSKKSSSHWSKKSKSKGWTKSWTKTKTKTNDRCRTAWVRGTVPTCIGSIQSCLPRSNSDGWTNQVHKGSQRLTMFADAEGCRTSGATVVGGAVVRVSDQSMEVQLEQTSGWTVGTTSMWIGTSMLPVVRRRYYSANPSYFPYKMSGNETQRFRFRSGRLPQKLYVAMQVEVCEIEVVTPPPGPEDECRIAWVRGRKPRCFRGLRGCEWETGPVGWTNTLYRGREEMDLVTASTCHSSGVTSGAVVVEMTGREVDVTLGVNDGWRVDSAAMHIGREKLPRRYNGWYTASPKAFPFQSTRDGLHKFKIVSGRSQCLYIAVWVKVCRVVVTVPPGTLPPTPGTPTPAVVTVPPTPGTPAPPTVPITAPPVPPTGTVPPSPPAPPTGTVPPTPPTGTVPPSPPTPPTPPTETVPPTPPTGTVPPSPPTPPTPPTGTVPPSPPTPPTPGTPAPPTVPITAPPVPPTGTVPPSPPTPPTGTVPPTPPTGTVPPSPPTPPTGTVPPSPPTPPTGTVPPTPPTGTVPPSPPSPPTPPTGTVPPTPPTTEPEPCVEEDVDVGAVVPSETVEGARTIVDWGEGRSVEEGMPGWPVGEVDTTITNIPAGLLRSRTRTFVPVSPAGLPEDSRVRVECPESCTGAPCEVVIAVYQCGACSANTNGGLPTLLPAAGWEVGNCAPTFQIGTGINYRMATYRTTVPSGQTLETPRLTQQLTNVAVFVRQGATDCAARTLSAVCNAFDECRWNAGSNSCESDWCPAPRTNTTGEATCSESCITPPPATRPPVPTPTGEGSEPAPTPRPTPTGEGGEPAPTPRPTPTGEGGEPAPTTPRPTDNGGEGGQPEPTDNGGEGGQPEPTDNGGEGGQPEPTDNGGEGGEAVTTPDNGGEPTFG